MNTEIPMPIFINQPRALWVPALVGTLLIGALTVFVAGVTVFLIIQRRFDIALVTACLGLFLFILLRYVARDTRGRKGWRVTLDADTVQLDLPYGRSLIHRLDPVHKKLRFDEISGVETRLEAYRSFGLANMHRSYALRLKTDEVIILGEDRALGTNMSSDFFADAVTRIADIAGLQLHDLGMAEGKGGFLSVLFTAPPPWDAPNLSADKQSTLWRSARWTGTIAMLATLLVVIALILQNLVFGS